jgi:hypothetical protein
MVKNLFLPLVTALSCLSLTEGAVIQNDAIIANAQTASLPLPGEGDHFFLTQTAPPGNGMFLYQVTSQIPHNFTFSDMGIAEPNRLFLSEFGDRFDVLYLQSHPSFATNWNNHGAGTFTLLPGESRYLAYWDLRFFSDNDLFGWAHLTNIDGQLVVAASATAVGGGIVVGTLERIPEPSTGGILASAVVAATLRRSRRNRRS